MTSPFSMTARIRPAVPAASIPRTGRLASAAILLSLSFILSRVLGVLRMSVIAAVFGDSRAVEAYFAAFRIPDTMFMLVSGGALASAFVPLFAGLLEEGHEEEAWRMASTILSSVLMALGALATLSFIFAPQVMAVLVGNASTAGSGGFTPAQRSLSVDLTRIMLLQPIFLGASAIVASILQTYNRFLLTALAPLLYNVAVIVGALVGRTVGISALAWSVVIGSALQLAIQAPGMWPQGRTRLRFAIDWSSSNAREVLRLFGPRIIGLAAFQSMLFITLFLAARLPHHMINAINYSWPLIQFPVGALGIAAGTAIFPTLSRLTSADDSHAVSRTVNRSLRLILFLAVPATVGLVVLRRPVINLLYAHGTKWTVQSTEDAAFALLFYALALLPLASIEVLARVFYAMRDTMTPVRIAIVAVTIDALLSILFVHVLPGTSGQGGLALATAIATTVQVMWLARAADIRLQGIGTRSLWQVTRDSSVASIAMGVVLYVLLDLLVAVLPQHGFGVLATLIVATPVGAGVFVYGAYLLGAPELWEVIRLLRHPRQQRSSAPVEPLK